MAKKIDLRKKIPLVIIVVFSMANANANTLDDGVEFNSSLLKTDDKSVINLDRFRDSSYIPSGKYNLNIILNRKRNINISDNILFKEGADGIVSACLTPEIVSKLGLEQKYLDDLKWDGDCLDSQSLPGTTAKAKLSKSQLLIDIPNSYLGFFSDNWVPSSLWSNGINGVFFDYNFIGNTYRPKSNGGLDKYSLTGNGVTGLNIGAWRFRGDWSSDINHETGSDEAVNKSFNWTRLFAYRAIKRLQAKLSVGENYISSDYFSSVRFLGVSLESDMSMVPPMLRGYSPEINGVAETNATVYVYKDNNIIYQTQVPPGPFSINDISDSVTGDLLVKIVEQSGSTREFTVSSNYSPYLTRPGDVRYRIFSGKPMQYDRHRTISSEFISAEFSIGAFNLTSLIAGGLVSKDYISSTYGIAQNMKDFGSVSFNLINANAKVNRKNFHGNAIKTMYTKRFTDFGGSIGISSLRYLDDNYMDFERFIYTDDLYYIDNEPYKLNAMGTDRINVSKFINAFNMSTSFTFSQNYYRDKNTTRNYQLNINKIMDLGDFKNASINFSFYQNEYDYKKNRGLSLNFSMPLNNGATLSYSTARDYDGKYSNRVGYFNRINNNTNYNLSSGVNAGNVDASGYINHTGDSVSVTANAGINKNYNSFGLNLRGGITATGNSLIAHGISSSGATRMVVDADNENMIPIVAMGKTFNTNRFGQVVIPDVSNYYKNTASVNLNKLPENVSVIDSVLDYSLTEGSIGYKKIGTVNGFKIMSVIRDRDGSYPPIGANIINKDNQLVGIVDDNGYSYIKGVRPNEVLLVDWSTGECNIKIPGELKSSDLISNLLLTCGK